jgi:hypothetical protein
MRLLSLGENHEVSQLKILLVIFGEDSQMGSVDMSSKR